MHLTRMKNINECLLAKIDAQMENLDCVDTKELGEAIDMVKDLSEALYYGTITKAMEESSYIDHSSTAYYRDIDKGRGRMYYTEQPEHMETRDSREGRSHMSRKSYMESREMHQDKATQVKELEKYISELTADITEMIADASQEEKQLLQRKISTLATKIV